MFKKAKQTFLSSVQSTRTAMKPTISGHGVSAKPRKHMIGGAPHKAQPTTPKGAMNSYRTAKVVSAKTHSTPSSKKPIRSKKYV